MKKQKIDLNSLLFPPDVVAASNARFVAAKKAQLAATPVAPPAPVKFTPLIVKSKTESAPAKPVDAVSVDPVAPVVTPVIKVKPTRDPPTIGSFEMLSSKIKGDVKDVPVEKEVPEAENVNTPAPVDFGVPAPIAEVKAEDTLTSPPSPDLASEEPLEDEVDDDVIDLTGDDVVDLTLSPQRGGEKRKGETMQSEKRKVAATEVVREPVRISPAPIVTAPVVSEHLGLLADMFDDDD
jgi:hypothetical protein